VQIITATVPHIHVGLSQFPKLERLENEYVSVLKERSDMIARRRSADDDDDLSTFFGPLSLALQSEPDEHDEYGRAPPNPATSKPERQSARARRRSRRVRNPSPEEEGYSTDASLPPSDAMDFTTAMQKLAADRHDILSDVRSVEFKDPSRGLGKWFGEWRSRFGDTYTGAWGGLGLVAAWEFWARLETVGWNPLDVSGILVTSTDYSPRVPLRIPGIGTASLGINRCRSTPTPNPEMMVRKRVRTVIWHQQWLLQP
jgi:GC-rich sequence DNA-binding factor